MDPSENMEQPNQSSSSTPTKRKRGRPVRSESQNQQVNSSVTTIDDNLIGQPISGVIEGSFDEGYMLHMKTKDQQFKGVVFIPDKIIPITPANDLFPHAKMYARKDIPNPSVNQQTPDKMKKKVTWKLPDIASEPQNKSATCTTLFRDNQPMSEVSVGSVMQKLIVATDKMKNRADVPVHSDGDLSTAEKQNLQPVLESGHEGQSLPLMLMPAKLPEECAESNARKDSITEVITASERTVQEATTSSLEVFQNEEKLTRTEQQRSPMHVELCGVDLNEKQASPVDVNIVAEELQVELGNQTMSGADIAMEDTEDN